MSDLDEAHAMQAWHEDRADLAAAMDRPPCRGCRKTHEVFGSDDAVLRPGLRCACDCHYGQIE